MPDEPDDNNNSHRKLAKVFLLLVTFAWGMFGVNGTLLLFLSSMGIGPIDPGNITLFGVFCSAVANAIVASLLFICILTAKRTSMFVLRLSQVMVWTMMLHVTVIAVFHSSIIGVITPALIALFFLLGGIVVSKTVKIAAKT